MDNRYAFQTSKSVTCNGSKHIMLLSQLVTFKCFQNIENKWKNKSYRTLIINQKPLDMVAEWVERGLHMREIGSFKLDTCHFLSWSLTLKGQGKNWLDQCQDNMAEWDIGSWSQPPDFPVG